MTIKYSHKKHRQAGLIRLHYNNKAHKPFLDR